MVSDGEASLKTAANLIRTGKANQAQPIIVQILREEPNNSQAWFLLSYALADPERQRYALEQALRSDPYFERAIERLEKLGGSTRKATGAWPASAGSGDVSPFFPGSAEEETPGEKREREVLPPVQPAFFGADEEESKAKIETREKARIVDRPRRRGCVRILLLLVFVSVLGSLVYFGRDYLGGVLVAPSNPTATEVQAFRTLPPTWTPSTTEVP